MTHTLTITLGDAADLAWAQATVTAAHYLRAPVDPRPRPIGQIRLGVAAAGAAVVLAGLDRNLAAHHAAILKGHP